MATVSRNGPAETLRLRPEVAFVPGVGLRAPPARHSIRFSFNVVYLLVFGFTNANRPARQLRGRGEWNRSL